MPPRDENPFHDPKAVADWVRMIESDQNRVREGDIYPLLKAWARTASELLEIGCGQGVCSAHLDLGNRRYTGVDAIAPLLERARQLYPHAFVLGDAYALPFPEETFDGVFSVAVWHLLEDLSAAAKELCRVLKTDGGFLLITANPGAYSLWTDRYTDGKFDGRRFEGSTRRQDGSLGKEVLYLHTLDELTTSLHDAGLHVDKTETFRGGQYLHLEGRR